MTNRITTVVIPATSRVDNEKLTKIKNLIQDGVPYLENITKCRYYPVPTIILDEIPCEDREQFGDPEDNDSYKAIHKLGVYFHPGKTVSQNISKILKNYGYNDAFIDSLATGGFVVMGYEQCKRLAERENKACGIEFFWDIFMAVLIHEHAHAITFEGIENNSQFNYLKGKFSENYAYKIVCESIAEWLGWNYFKNDEAMNAVLQKHSQNNNKSIIVWPYGGAVYLKKEYEKDKNVFKKIFDAFRKQHIGESVCLFLSDAEDFVIKLFCAFKKHKNFKKLATQIPSNKSILSEALKFIDCEDFLKILIQHSADVNGQDAYGDTPLMLLCGAGNLAHVRWLYSKNADLNKQNNNGDTALIFAGLNNQREILHILLLGGASLDVKNNKGKALIDMDISDKIKGDINSWISSKDEI